jgi:hypothetical protein
VVELVFMMVILKLPILYLGAVCWWAIRAEPDPLEGAHTRMREGEGPRRWRPRPDRRPRRGGPHAGRNRRSTRVQA